MLLWNYYDDQPYVFEPCRRIPAITPVDDSSSNSNNRKFLYTFCVLCFKHRLIHRIVNCKFLRVYFFFNNWFVNKLQKFKPTKYVFVDQVSFLFSIYTKTILIINCQVNACFMNRVCSSELIRLRDISHNSITCWL